jgi:hypothetical protein
MASTNVAQITAGKQSGDFTVPDLRQARTDWREIYT